MQDRDIIVNSTGTGTLGRIGLYSDRDNPNNLPLVPDSHVTIVRVCKVYRSIFIISLNGTSRILKKAAKAQQSKRN